MLAAATAVGKQAGHNWITGWWQWIGENDAQVQALTSRARMMRTTDAGKTSMSVPLLNAEAAPEGAALWLQMTQEQNPGHNLTLSSGRLHGRLTATPGARGTQRAAPTAAERAR